MLYGEQEYENKNKNDRALKTLLDSKKKNAGRLIQILRVFESFLLQKKETYNVCE